MSFEHAPDDRRGFFTSFTLSGTQGGQVLAPARVPAARRRAARGPAARLGLADPVLAQRRASSSSASSSGVRLEETPEFRAEADRDEVPRAPLGVLFRDHWAGVLRVFFAAFIAMVNTTFQVFALNFATSDDYGIGISSTIMLWLAIVANLVAIATIPFWARLSDRVGRKPVFVAGVAGQRRAGHRVPRRRSRRQRRRWSSCTGVLLAGVVYRMPNAVWPATYAEYFPTSVRALRHGDRHPVRLRAGRLHPDASRAG